MHIGAFHRASPGHSKIEFTPARKLLCVSYNVSIHSRPSLCEYLHPKHHHLTSSTEFMYLCSPPPVPWQLALALYQDSKVFHEYLLLLDCVLKSTPLDPRSLPRHLLEGCFCPNVLPPFLHPLCRVVYPVDLRRICLYYVG